MVTVWCSGTKLHPLDIFMIYISRLGISDNVSIQSAPVNSSSPSTLLVSPNLTRELQLCLQSDQVTLAKSKGKITQLPL